MVANLFKCDLRAVLQASLVSFTQDWIERFFERMCCIEKGLGKCNYVLHSFYRIISAESSGVEVDRSVKGKRSHYRQYRPRRHALNREGHFVKLKLSAQNHATNLLDEVFQSTAELLENNRISEGDASVGVRLRSSIIIR